MSTQPDEELYDPWANDRKTVVDSTTAPVISWANVKIGTVFAGLVIPGDLDRPDKGYKMRRDYQSSPTEIDPYKGPKVWPPNDNDQGVKRAVTEAFYRRTWGPLPTDVGKVSQTHVTLLTEYAAGEFMSDEMIKRIQDADGDPDNVGLRRVIVESSASLKTAILAALDGIGSPPAAGQYWRVKLVDRKPNDKKGKTNIFDVKIEAPTEDRLAQAKARFDLMVIEAAKKADVADKSDPWANTDEPPF